MHLRFRPYTLELKRAFTIASYSRSTTPALLVEVEHDGIIGYGEASMPPYLGENIETASRFLSGVRLGRDMRVERLAEVLHDIDMLAPGNHAAKAAVDIALHDWLGKKNGFAWHQHWGLGPSDTPLTSFTIGMTAEKEVIRQNVREAGQFKILKVKLGSENDKEMIETIREVTDKPLRVDVNQGWETPDRALLMIEWLATHGVELVEQPLPKEQRDEQVWLRERSPLPLIADESVSRLADMQSMVGAFDGINVKLMKCTGMNEARNMIALARSLHLKVMLGCMTETSCAISAATQLSPLADYADLDGAALIANDPFTGASIEAGRMIMPAGSGIGACPRV